MSALEALKAARNAGIQVEIDHDHLSLSAFAPPPAAVLDLLARNKAGVIALLRSSDDGWSGEDWLAFFDERAGTAEFDNGLSREEAEAHAFDCCVIEWLNRNPVQSTPGRCLQCGNEQPERVLPFGVDPVGRAWLHPYCWPSWQAGRCAEAVAALKSMGISNSNVDQ